MAPFLRPTDLASSDLIRQAEKTILADYGDVVSVIRKQKNLFKFGANADVGTSYETVWAQGGDETYVNDNSIDSFSSSNAGDTQQIQIEGHTLDQTTYKATFVVQTVTLQGTTKRPLTTPLSRVTRIANLGTADFAGVVYVYEDDATATPGVPDTASKIHAIAQAPQNQTLKCATTISDKDYWIITELSVGVRRNTAAAADFEVQIREIGATNKAFRSVLFLSANQSGAQLNVTPPLIVPRNHDFRIRGIASTTSVSLAAGANGYLAKVIGRKNTTTGVIEEVA